MLSVYEPGQASLAHACDGEEMENFRILLQVSVDRLYEACRPTPRALAHSLGRYHYHCSRAREGYAWPQVPGVGTLPLKSRSRAEGETTFDVFMRLLGEYGFHFHDLGLARNNASLGRLAIRRELDDLMEAWADNQFTFADRAIAKTAGRIALNGIQFSPPRASVHVVMGTVIEGGVSVVPFGWRSHWFQATGAVELLNLTSLLTPGEQHVSFALVAGPEFHLSFLSNAIIQPRLALRGGVLLGTRDGFGTASCSEVSPDPRWCTTGVIEGVISLSLLERIRAQMAWQTFPGLMGRDSRWYNLHFALGLQF
jgi:hypothetical protein